MSDLDSFYESQGRFSGLSVNEQICRIAWFIHNIRQKSRFSPREVADLFKELHLSPPRVDVYLPRMWEKKPQIMLWDKGGYFLEGKTRKNLDDKLNPNSQSVSVSNLLKGLTESVGQGPERTFLDEAIRCYGVAAFRAAIVMTWNLAYDHLRRWVIEDKDRLTAFNFGAIKRFTKKPKMEVSKIDDFEDFKESEFIDACASGNVISKNIEEMLREKLKRRNMAAHPSAITILQPQADDVITDLVKNVVLAL